MRPERRNSKIGSDQAESRRTRKASERGERNDHHNDVQLKPLEMDGEKLLETLRAGKMVGVLSKMEMMYVFLYHGGYHCFIHPLDGEEGRRKSFPENERNTAMFKNLTAAADQLFAITPKEGMDPMGVMVAAERGIIAYLDMTGQLPAEDVDFMSWQDAPKDDNEEVQRPQ